MEAFVNNTIILAAAAAAGLRQPRQWPAASKRWSAVRSCLVAGTNATSIFRVVEVCGDDGKKNRESG